MSPRARPRRVAGYTIIELLMSLTVLAIGVSGVIAMQKVTLSTNRHARALSVATRVAQAWADQLAVDATLWRPDAIPGPRDNTAWLNLALPNTTVDWFAPGWSPNFLFGPGFDPLGNPVDTSVAPALAHFCTHLRFAFMHSETAPSPGNGAIRAQIRVFWRRDDSPAPPPGTDDLCAISDADFIDNMDALHVVYLTTAVRESPGRS